MAQTVTSLFGGHRRGAHQGARFADKMRLIEIPGFVSDVGPGSCRVSTMRRQRCIKPDCSRVQLGRKPDLRGETALKLTRTQTGSLDEAADPGAAPRRDQKARRNTYSVIRRTAVQHDTDPPFRSGHARGKIWHRPHGID